MNLDEGFDVVSVGSGLGGMSFRSMAGGPQKVSKAVGQRG
jgi:hypothetical protein